MLTENPVFHGKSEEVACGHCPFDYDDPLCSEWIRVHDVVCPTRATYREACELAKGKKVCVKEFFYQIKGKDTGSCLGNWAWPPLFTGKVEAPDKKTAKALIEEEYGRSFPTRVLQKDLDSNEFLLGIKEIEANDHFTRRLFEVTICKQCQKPFKVIEKYTFNSPGGGPDFCCSECAREWDAANSRHVSSVMEGNNPPVIYCITNRATGMCYVGKTRQVFTLRWYQHFFQGSDTRFHQAIKASPVIDWSFEVLEVVHIPEEIRAQGMVEMDRHVFAQEKHWIGQRDSVAKGYNTQGPVEASGSLFSGDEEAA